MNKPQPVAPVPTMSREEVDRLRELLAANDQQEQANTRAEQAKRQRDLEEQVILAAKLQDELNSVTYETHKEVSDSFLVIRQLVERLARIHPSIRTKEQLSQAGFDVFAAVQADRLVINVLQARLDACQQFETDWDVRLKVLEEHLGAVRTHSEGKIRDIDHKIILKRSAIGRAGIQREENTKKLVSLGLDLGLAREKAKPKVEEVEVMERELVYLLEQREKHAAIVRSNVLQADIAFNSEGQA